MRKQFLKLLAAAVLILSLAGHRAVDVSAGSMLACPCELPGDVNDDSVTDFYDFAAALVFVYTQSTPEFLACDGQSDPDGNGYIQTADYDFLQRWGFQVYANEPVCAP